MSDEPIVITNRVIYDTLNTHISEVREWQTTHAASDQRSFNSLNIKFYGILAGMLAVLVALGAAIRV